MAVRTVFFFFKFLFRIYYGIFNMARNTHIFFFFVCLQTIKTRSSKRSLVKATIVRIHNVAEESETEM